ncbi:hypothetical protein PQ465_14680 [Sphingobacterium oryzagri]|uniref:ABC transporter permease n=1 Tax=Sphingobacterium oryzagri TaxID=3025669 RepID=A0ABY7WGB1_9SPHI|nr:hypothetical protein [Sphingobacterium sp. KACC 22765]WDF67542.1 hypothetical protein PQ465_14680 [Sphingobacterium sp. KACC 22765]
MQYYFKLQYRIIRRSIEETGIPFIVGFGLFIAMCIAGYYLLSHYASLAQYLLPYLAVSLLLTLSDEQRLDHLRTLFSKRKFYRLRVLENSLLVAPLLLLACLAGLWLAALLSFGLALLFASFHPKLNWHRAMPTPFRRHPFEFIIFFRRRLWLLLLFSALLAIAMYVGNFNLAIVLFAIITLTVVGEVYNVIEPEIVLWNFSDPAALFLRRKLGRGEGQLLLLLAPFFIGLSLRFSEQLTWLCLAVLLGGLLLALLLFVKYAIYPRQAGLLEGLIFVFAASMPIGLLILFPYYFRKAKRNLEKYHDQDR